MLRREKLVLRRDRLELADVEYANNFARIRREVRWDVRERHEPQIGARSTSRAVRFASCRCSPARRRRSDWCRACASTRSSRWPSRPRGSAPRSGWSWRARAIHRMRSCRSRRSRLARGRPAAGLLDLDGRLLEHRPRARDALTPLSRRVSPCRSSAPRSSTRRRSARWREVWTSSCLGRRSRRARCVGAVAAPWPDALDHPRPAGQQARQSRPPPRRAMPRCTQGRSGRVARHDPLDPDRAAELAERPEHRLLYVDDHLARRHLLVRQCLVDGMHGRHQVTDRLMQPAGVRPVAQLAGTADDAAGLSPRSGPACRPRPAWRTRPMASFSSKMQPHV